MVIVLRNIFSPGSLEWAGPVLLHCELIDLWNKTSEITVGMLASSWWGNLLWLQVWESQEGTCWVTGAATGPSSETRAGSFAQWLDWGGGRRVNWMSWYCLAQPCISSGGFIPCGVAWCLLYPFHREERAARLVPAGLRGLLDRVSSREKEINPWWEEWENPALVGDVAREEQYLDYRRWAAGGLALVQGRSLGLLVWKVEHSAYLTESSLMAKRSVGCISREQWADLMGAWSPALGFLVSVSSVMKYKPVYDYSKQWLGKSAVLIWSRAYYQFSKWLSKTPGTFTNVTGC